MSFYEALYSEESMLRPGLEGLVFNRLLGEDSERLERPFEVEEVWGVVKEMNGEKAPGPMVLPCLFSIHAGTL